jgi:hypothetical protein
MGKLLALVIYILLFLLWKYSAKIEGAFKKLFGKSGGNYEQKGEHSLAEIKI